MALKPKTPPKPQVTVKTPEAPAAPEARRLPLSIKGVINFSGLGFRLLTVDEDGGYHRMQEGDEFPYMGETYTIKKITADGAVFTAPNGGTVVLKNDFDFAKAVEQQGSGTARSAAPRSAPAAGGSKGKEGKAGNAGGKSGASAGNSGKAAKGTGGNKNVDVNKLMREAKNRGVDVNKVMREAGSRGISPKNLQKLLHK